MTVAEIFATASFDEWLISAFALFGAGTFCVLVFRFSAALCEKYIGGEYSDGNNDHDQKAVNGKSGQVGK